MDFSTSKGHTTTTIFIGSHLHIASDSTMTRYYTAVIFDLGDVLITWSTSPSTSLPAKTLRNIIRSVHWFEYEKGNLTEAEVYSLVAQEFSVSFIDVKNSFEAARKTLQSNSTFLEVVRELKESGLAIYAMTNVSTPDWYLQLLLQNNGRFLIKHSHRKFLSTSRLHNS